MKNSRTHNIRLGCEITLSVISVVLAILFITFIAQIYYAGNFPAYTREIVWGKLKYLIAPLAIWVAAIIGCFVLSVLFPDEKRNAPPPTATERVSKLRKRIPKKRDTDGKYVNAEHKQYTIIEIMRYVAFGVASAFALGVAIYTIVYLSQKSNFSSEAFNTDVLNLVKNVFPWIIASFVLFIGVIIYEFVVAKPQLNRMSKLLVACKGTAISRSPLASYMDRTKAALIKSEDKILFGVRIAVLLVAVVFIGIGTWDGGAGDVLAKAIAICKECIGVG